MAGSRTGTSSIYYLAKKICSLVGTYGASDLGTRVSADFAAAVAALVLACHAFEALDDHLHEQAVSARRLIHDRWIRCLRPRRRQPVDQLLLVQLDGAAGLAQGGVGNAQVAQASAFPAPVADSFEAVEAYIPYLEARLAEGVRLHDMTRHMLGLFTGLPGARAWRRTLATKAVVRGAGVEVVREALGMLSQEARASEAAQV